METGILKMRLTSLILLLISANSWAKQANTTNQNSELFLVGGGLKSCSSMSQNQCQWDKKQLKNRQENAKSAALYQLTHENKSKLFSLFADQYDEKHAKQLKKLLNKAIKQADKKPVTKAELISFLKKYDNNRLINRLSDPEYYLLLDALEVPQMVAKSNKRIKEKVYLAESKNIFSKNIYLEYVERARQLSGKKRPNILVVTASARDSFEAVDFYQQAFEQAGANSQWLPIDASLQALLSVESNNRTALCEGLSKTRLAIQKSAFREDIYPDLYQIQQEACVSPQLLIEAVNNADGIFINGGDQSLTKQAFVKDNGNDSSIMKAIRQKFSDGNFIIGGTSAGTAVMSGGNYLDNTTVMITNGRSERAVVYGSTADQLPTEGCQKSSSCKQLPNDQLTYASNGGLGLFPYGILDTHFSERGRQGRLAQLLYDTQSAFAFGVDERTALIVTRNNSGKVELGVSGESGVFIVERESSSKTNQRKFNTHYLHQGDSATLSKRGNVVIEFSADKTIPSNETGSLPLVEDIFKGQVYKSSAKLLCLSDQPQLSGVSYYDDHKVKIALHKSPQTVTKHGTYKFGNQVKDDCSYRHVTLNFIE